jgi:hypothetical protein
MTFVQGLGAGICCDIATVKLPTRHRIGVAEIALPVGASDIRQLTVKDDIPAKLSTAARRG